MPEIEIRVAATEAFLKVLMLWIDEDALHGARTLLVADLTAARGNDERLVYLNALRILDETQRLLATPVR